MSKNVMISIKPQYVDKILSGEKTIELRKSFLGLEGGDIVWVYTTAPRSEISFYFEAWHGIQSLVDTFWRDSGNCTGLSEQDYKSYYEGHTHVFGFDLTKKYILKTPVKRSECPPFHPPQSVLNLDKNKELWRFLRQKVEV